MPRLFVALAIVFVVAVLALVQRRRRQVDVPTQSVARVPSQLNRSDFSGADVDWLLVVFTSATCQTCADVARKAHVAASGSVHVVDVEFGQEPGVHRRYGIEAVPTTLLADRAGVVRASFMGPMSATDLWAAIAEAREPGTGPAPCHGQHGPRVG